MVNAQEWLNEKFPTRESREIKRLSITNDTSTGGLSLGEYYTFTKLEGELDLSSFASLEVLYLRRQLINRIKLNPSSKLVRLDVSDCNALQVIKGLGQCQTIYCACCNQLSTIEGLENCTQLVSFTPPPHFNFSSFLNSWRQQNQELVNLVFPNSSYNFTQLHQELKRLKIQDLNIQIPLKKQELEQSTNNLKNNLGSAGKYLLDKLLKKQQKILLNNENTSDKLEVMKQVLTEELNNRESLPQLLNQQKEVFNLEKHLNSLHNEQIAQIVYNLPRNN